MKRSMKLLLIAAFFPSLLLHSYFDGERLLLQIQHLRMTSQRDALRVITFLCQIMEEINDQVLNCWITLA